MNISVTKTEAMASEVWFDSHMMHVRLLEGREINVPIERFPKLRSATEEQRKKWRLIGRGIGIHWEDIDEDISIASLSRAVEKIQEQAEGQAGHPLENFLMQAEKAYTAYMEAQRQVASAYKENERQITHAYRRSEEQAKVACSGSIAQALKAREEATAQALKAREEAERQVREAYAQAVEEAEKTCDEAIAQALRLRDEDLERAWKIRQETMEQAWTIYARLIK